MIKKITIRVDMDDEQHRQAMEILKGRNKSKHKSMTEYIVSAIIEFEKLSGKTQPMQLSEQDKQQIIKEVLQGLDEKRGMWREPGI